MSEQSINKTCRVCKQTKPITEFYKCSRTKGGYKNDCKSCHLEYWNNYRKTERGKQVISKIKHKYHQTEKGKATKRRVTENYCKTDKGKNTRMLYEQSERGKTLARNRAEKHRQNHPQHAKALQVVRNAIRSGKLPRPDILLCHYCPKPAQQYHHWHGYEKKHWLDVVPVCVSCHGKTRKIS